MTYALPRPAADLAAALGLDPSVAPLLDLAMSHRSFAYEHGRGRSNERLEWLGDTVLAAGVTRALYDEFPDESEGILARRRSDIVRNTSLATAARAMGLGEYVKLGRGEEASGGRSKTNVLADAFEAVIGAVTLHCGHETATAVALRLLAPQFARGRRPLEDIDPKTHLQQLCSQLGYAQPEYAVTDAGPDHAKSYHAEVLVGDVATGTGQGGSKKEAEHNAARAACQQLGELPAA